MSHLETMKLLLAPVQLEEDQNDSKVKRKNSRSSPLVVSHQVEVRSMEMPRPSVEDLTFSK